MDLEIGMPNAVSQRKETSHDTSCEWTLKRNDTDGLTYKTSAVFFFCLPGTWP